MKTIEKKIRLVCGTRSTNERFFQSTALGKSLALYGFLPFELQLFPENSAGLPTIYNSAIKNAEKNPAILVFLHDDLHLCDFFWTDQIKSGLMHFDVVGLAGNKGRQPKQPAWSYVDENFTWDRSENLSGVVGHGKGFPPEIISAFGSPCQECKLLDGLLLAADSTTLIKNRLRFDTRFDFHFYDMDFCRQAEIRGLKMGTWPISVVHESGGAFGSDSWRKAYMTYLEKYGEQQISAP